MTKKEKIEEQNKSERLELLYKKCIAELESIGLDLSQKSIGTISIQLAKRNNQRYGCCKQEEPDERYKIVNKVGRRKIIKYEKFNKHNIEISKWVLDLNEEIIKNTIMHEIIHCFPFCNNHGKQFKAYAEYINKKLGYNITRLGNKKEDFKKSNVEYEEKTYKYTIKCTKCGKLFHRNRLAKNFFRRYRCQCGGKLEFS
ncbi:MAG: SprT-like domain-containing protein [Clostridia bacterium]|nr:SprT-like domain-containing protein [Clostridia bacterium]